MIYTCEKCNKTFKQKSNYDYHIGRKRPCIKEDNILNDVKEIDNNITPIITPIITSS